MMAELTFGNICCCSQDIKLHIKPMPKKLAFVPAIITKLVSNSIMFSVSIVSLSLPFSGHAPHGTFQYPLTHYRWPTEWSVDQFL